MKIAVNARFLSGNPKEGYGYFIQETLGRITRQNPADEFIYIFDRPWDSGLQFEKNVTPVVAGPPARHPLLWKWWYDVRIPLLLKKYRADVFLSCDGFGSLTTSVPQCIVIHDLAFKHYPSFIKSSHLSFYKRNTPKYILKARSLATVSEFSKRDIADTYAVEPEKIHVIYNGVKELFKPLAWEQQAEVKNKYTGGREFFIYTGAIHPRKNLLNLLRAFSVFKKKQQSSWKLVLAGRLAWKNEAFLESLKSYKYREDVVLTGYLPEEELALLTGSAYAMVYPSLWEGFGVPVVEAMRCGTPVVTSANSAMQEISDGAALYADPESHTDIADKMMLLYKNENLRSQLTEKGKEVAARYNWDDAAAALWQAIRQAAGKEREH